MFAGSGLVFNALFFAVTDNGFTLVSIFGLPTSLVVLFKKKIWYRCKPAYKLGITQK